MNNYLGLILKDFKKLWMKLNFTQKLAILALVVVTGVVISYFLAKSTEPDWAVLYSDLSEPDAAAVCENLKKAGYVYKMSDDKKAILVPSAQKEDLRMMIAENDVIHDSNPGFELLDKMQLGATDFQNKLTKQRIFQGELTRTIEKINGIKKARVQLAEPERSVFSENDEDPSASVMLILEPGFKPDKDQIKGIKNLVAYAIPRLKPEKVFLTDQFGNPLSDEVNSGSNDIKDFRSAYETDTAKKITKVLEKIVGADNVSVQVTATMNFDSAKSTIERYIPVEGTTNGIVQSTQDESEKYGKGNALPQTGATTTSATPDPNKMNYEKVRTQTNYNVSKEVKQVVYAPGSVQRLTVAVALNKILTTEEKDEIKKLVISASGADETRGDTIEITSMQFADDNTSKSQEMLDAIQKDSQTEFWVKTVAPLAVVLILGLSALFILNSLIRKPISGEEVYDSQEYYDDADDSEELSLLEASAVPVIEAKLDPEVERMKVDINNIIMSDPSEASRLLLSYIRE